MAPLGLAVRSQSESNRDHLGQGTREEDIVRHLGPRAQQKKHAGVQEVLIFEYGFVMFCIDICFMLSMINDSPGVRESRTSHRAPTIPTVEINP